MNAKRTKRKDPHAAREADRYDNPIPSREMISETLREHGRLMTLQAIAQALDLRGDRDMRALDRRVSAMVRDGQLAVNRRGRYGLTDKMDLIAGRVSANAEGFGFLVPDEGGDDIFLAPKQMRQVLHGDRTLVTVTRIDRKGRSEGRIVEVLERGHSHLVGRLYKESQVVFVVPDNPRLHQDILVPDGHGVAAEHGDYVYVELVEQPTRHRQPVGRILEVLGRSVDAPMAVEIAIRSFELPHEWPNEIVDAVRQTRDHVSEAEIDGRRDLRKLPLVTIDGEDAKDFDDAVHCKRRRGGGWTLYVAIADVAHYVPWNSPLDIEARRRGTSAYFPNRVVPMLPEALSNGICSLRPDVDRLCMVCEMRVSGGGKVESSRFYDAVMRSQARLTYTQVAAMIAGDTEARHKSLSRHILELHNLYQAFAKRREKRGALDFDSTEVRFKLGKDDVVDDIVPYERNDAHRLIEECMIAANVQAAQFLGAKKIPALYRVHAPPKLDKYERMKEFLAGLGIRVPIFERLAPVHVANIISAVRDRPDAALIQAVLLRSQSLASYEAKNDGHFGLALEAYAHFTSPIRRYPDLMVHRAIRHGTQRRKPSTYMVDGQQMGELADHCSMTERRAEDASRDVDDRLKCMYMQQHVGDQFDGIVSGVTSFGLFVELNRTRVNGLVHVTGLPNDYYHFDPVTHTLTGERRGLRFSLADSVRVSVTNVDLDERKIDFELIR